MSMLNAAFTKTSTAQFPILVKIGRSCVCALFAFAPADANSQEYFAKGQIEIVTKLGPTDGGKTNSMGFYVEALGNNYKVRMEEAGRKDRYYEYAFQDPLMYILHHIAGTRGSPETSGRLTNEPTMFPARIEERETPPNDGTRAQFVWFALASRGFFANLTNEYMLPLWAPEDPKTHRQPFSMMVFRELLPEPPQLPAKVSFINDGFYRSYNPVTKVVDVKPLNAPFDKGYTNAIYQVIALTNTAKNTLPAEFVFAVYSSPLNLGEIPFERVMVRGVVAEAGDSAPEGARISYFDGRATVVDYRINGSVRRAGLVSEYKYAAYPVTNGAWLTSNQLANVRKGMAKTEELRLESRLRQSPRIVIIGIMGGLSGLGIWFFWHAMRQNTVGK